MIAKEAILNARVAIVLLGLLVSASAMAQQCDSSSNADQTRACIGHELSESDHVINDVYAKVMQGRDAAGKAGLRAEQRAWLKERDDLCHLDNKIYDRDAWIAAILSDYMKTVCVVHLTRTRITSLQQMLAPPNSVPSAAATPPKTPQTDAAFDGKAPTVHSTGKWYFEFTLNSAAIAAVMPSIIVLGVSDKERKVTGAMLSVTGHDPNAESMRIGIAVDLDNGKLYWSKNGAWQDGQPGSNMGTDLKTGRAYYSVFMISALEQKQQMLDSKAFIPNFGDHPLAYALPDGYSPWRNQNLQ